MTSSRRPTGWRGWGAARGCPTTSSSPPAAASPSAAAAAGAALADAHAALVGDAEVQASCARVRAEVQQAEGEGMDEAVRVLREHALAWRGWAAREARVTALDGVDASGTE